MYMYAPRSAASFLLERGLRAVPLVASLASLAFLASLYFSLLSRLSLSLS